MRGTTPVLPDTGSVLTISTAPVLAEYGNETALPVLAENYTPVPASTGRIRVFHYWITSAWTVLTSQYWARSDFHNGHGTKPVLPDTGSVLTISTAPVVAEYEDYTALPVLVENCIPVPASTGLTRTCHYYLASIWTVLATSTGIVLITLIWYCIHTVS